MLGLHRRSSSPLSKVPGLRLSSEITDARFAAVCTALFATTSTKAITIVDNCNGRAEEAKWGWFGLALGARVPATTGKCLLVWEDNGLDIGVEAAPGFVNGFHGVTDVPAKVHDTIPQWFVQPAKSAVVNVVDGPAIRVDRNRTLHVYLPPGATPAQLSTAAIINVIVPGHGVGSINASSSKRVFTALDQDDHSDGIRCGVSGWSRIWHDVHPEMLRILQRSLYSLFTWLPRFGACIALKRLSVKVATSAAWDCVRVFMTDHRPQLQLVRYVRCSWWKCVECAGRMDVMAWSSVVVGRSSMGAEIRACAAESYDHRRAATTEGSIHASLDALAALWTCLGRNRSHLLGEKSLRPLVA